MNTRAFDVFLCLLENPELSQREIARALNIAPSYINRVLQGLRDEGKLDEQNGRYAITEPARTEFEKYRVKNAVIQVAGLGSRFVPLTYDTPKSLITVRGERLLERQLRQLKERGIEDITLVVGYMKEKFEYLKDMFNLKMVYNPDFRDKNTLYTILRVKELMDNTYVLCGDHYFSENPFHAYEHHSWYTTQVVPPMRDKWIVKRQGNYIGSVNICDTGGEAMLGPVYLTRECSHTLVKWLEYYAPFHTSANYYWEDVWKKHIKEMPLRVNPMTRDQFVEIDTLDALRAFDPSYMRNMDNAIFDTIKGVFHVEDADITEIEPMKMGMTNHSFRFNLKGDTYIFRKPGEGTQELVDRGQEALNLQAVKPTVNFTDEVLYFDAKTGVKISRFIHGTRTAESDNSEDVENTMRLLRELHEMDIMVPHRFNVRAHIQQYEDCVRRVNAMLFEDYAENRVKAEKLLDILDTLQIPDRFCHCDSAFENILRLTDGSYRIIDWEYAAMADPIMDVSFLAIYGDYTRTQAEHLLRLMLEREPEALEYFRLYAYMALGGLQWSLWALYKQANHVDFGEYIMNQYRYFKNYYPLACETLDLYQRTAQKNRA